MWTTVYTKGNNSHEKLWKITNVYHVEGICVRHMCTIFGCNPIWIVVGFFFRKSTFFCKEQWLPNKLLQNFENRTDIIDFCCVNSFIRNKGYRVHVATAKFVPMIKTNTNVDGISLISNSSWIFIIIGSVTYNCWRSFYFSRGVTFCDKISSEAKPI